MSEKSPKPVKESVRRVVLDSSSPSVRSVVRTVLVALIVIFVFSSALRVISLLSELILLVILAIFFAYLLAPAVDFLRRLAKERGVEKWLPRTLAIVVVYVGIIALLWLISAFLVPRISEQAGQFAGNVPNYIQTVKNRAEELNERYKDVAVPPEVRQQAQEKVVELITMAGQIGTTSVAFLILGSAHFIPWLILIPVLGFFLLKDANRFKQTAVSIFPRGRWRWRVDVYFQDLNKAIAAYTRAQLISCVLIGTISTIAFYLIGVKYALLLGLIAAILEFIPLIGPFTIAVLATSIAAFDSSNQAIATAIFSLVLRMAQDYVFYPRIVRESVHLHPLAVILAVLAGGEIGGIVGIFLAIPVIAVVTVTYHHLLAHTGSTGLVAKLLELDETETPDSNEGEPDAQT